MRVMRLTKSKARVLSTICTNIAQVLFAAFVAAIVLPLDSAKTLVVIFELVLSVIFWVLAILFGQKGRL